MFTPEVFVPMFIDDVDDNGAPLCPSAELLAVEVGGCIINAIVLCTLTLGPHPDGLHEHNGVPGKEPLVWRQEAWELAALQ